MIKLIREWSRISNPLLLSDLLIHGFENGNGLEILDHSQILYTNGLENGNDSQNETTTLKINIRPVPY